MRIHDAFIFVCYGINVKYVGIGQSDWNDQFWTLPIWDTESSDIVRHASNSHIGALVRNATQHCKLIPSVQGIKCFPTRWEQVSVSDSGVGTTELWRGHSWIVG